MSIRLSAVTFDTNGNYQLVHTAFPGGPAFIDAFPDHYRQLCGPEDPFQVQYDQLNPQNVVWRDGRLYFPRVFSVNDQYGRRHVARWYQVTTNGWPHTGSNPTVEAGTLDGGRIFLDGLERPVHYRYPLVMPTESGGMVLFVTRVLSTGYVDLICTGRRAIDPAGWPGARVTTVRAGQSAVNTTIWGDYEGIALDPLNSNRVWICGETGRCSPDAECED